MSDIITRLNQFLDGELKSKSRINILEAGCGSLSKIIFKQEAYVTGIDISAKQLERNKFIHEKIRGDLQQYKFPPCIFDIIVCWDVLEHLPKPKLALDRMRESLKPGGLLLLKLPNLMSFKGLFTKFSPHRIHVLYYRLIYKQPNAGKDDTGPFKTFLRYAVSPQELKRYAKENGLIVPFFTIFDILDMSYTFKRTKHPGLLRGVYNTIKLFSSVLSFGALKGSEVIIIMQKNPTS